MNSPPPLTIQCEAFFQQYIKNHPKGILKYHFSNLSLDRVRVKDQDKRDYAYVTSYIFKLVT